jgi:two-component system, chemotaxis family, chemotaxis protein CheY
MKRILIVDDSTTMRRMVAASLRKLSGVTLEEASTGLEAIERLSLFPASLMILDLNMPDMHGLDVLRFVRSQQSRRTFPIIILTTRSDSDSRTAAAQAGATVYMTKPFDPEEILAKVGELLGLPA